MTTLADIRDFVRLWLDVDEEDTPSAVIDHGIREACRIIWNRAKWKWALETFTLTTSGGVRDYDVEALASGVTTGSTLHKVHAVYGPTWELSFTDESSAFRKYQSLTTGDPREWSQIGSTLRLWPTPTGSTLLLVYGQRGPTDWVALGDTSTPDLPDEFHDLIKTWALHTAYLHQDDPEMAGETQNLFQSGLNQLASENGMAPDAAPVVVNQGILTENYDDPSRLRFPFE